MSKPFRILVGLVAGSAAGLACHLAFPDSPYLDSFIRNIAQPAGQIFLRMLLAIVVPLVFSALVLGVYELGDMRSVGRVGFKTLLVTLVSSFASVLIGLGLVNLFHPGVGFAPDALARLGLSNPADVSKSIEKAKAATGTTGIISQLITKNPLSAAVNALEGEMLGLMVFALLFGLALALVRGDVKDDPLVRAFETLRDVSMKIVDFAMRLAPIGVAGLMFALTARTGLQVFALLGKYVLVVLGGLLIEQLVVFSLLLKGFSDVSPLRFLRATREVIITAFSTASSNATLPTSIRVAEENLGLDRRVSSFVLTVGSTANQNGTALFEGVTVLFLAQVFQVPLTLSQQVTVLFLSVAAGIGTAGVPGGSLPMIMVVLQTVGVPPESIGLILGVDRLLDMSRSVLNVTGDLVVACIVDASEKKLLAQADVAQAESFDDTAPAVVSVEV